jgi:hypothetical protein
MSTKDPEDTRQEDSAQGGEFTRFFGGAKPPIDSSEQATTIQPVPNFDAPRASEKSPEPTRVDPKPNPVKLPRVQRPPSSPHGFKFPAQTPDPASGPGEFTRLFSMPSTSSPNPGAMKPTNAPPAAPQPSPEGESEFTRFFNAPQLPNAREVDWNKVKEQPPPQPAKSEGTFTRFFDHKADAGAAHREPERNFGPMGKKNSYLEEAPFQADEFAKVVAPRARSNQAGSTRPAPTAAASSPGSANSANPAIETKPGAQLSVLIICIAAVLILAVFAIYYFVVR